MLSAELCFCRDSLLVPTRFQDLVSHHCSDVLWSHALPPPPQAVSSLSCLILTPHDEITYLPTLRSIKVSHGMIAPSEDSDLNTFPKSSVPNKGISSNPRSWNGVF